MRQLNFHKTNQENTGKMQHILNLRSRKNSKGTGDQISKVPKPTNSLFIKVFLVSILEIFGTPENYNYHVVN